MVPRSLKDAKKDKKSLTSDEIYVIIRTWINSQVDVIRREQESNTNFDTPAWSERQAYHLGMLKGLDKVLNFIPLTKGNEDV